MTRVTPCHILNMNEMNDKAPTLSYFKHMNQMNDKGTPCHILNMNEMNDKCPPCHNLNT